MTTQYDSGRTREDLINIGRHAINQRARAIAGSKARTHALRELAKLHPEDYNLLRQQALTARPPYEPNTKSWSEEQLARFGERQLRFQARTKACAKARREQLKQRRDQGSA